MIQIRPCKTGLILALAITLGFGGGKLLAQSENKVPLPKEAAEALQMETQALDLAKQGRIAEAEDLYKRSLATMERALPNDPILAVSLNNVGSFYIGQKRYSDAAPLLARALAIFAGAYGDNKVETATALNNLAGVYMAEGKFNDAEPLYLRGLAATENLLGPGHYGVAMSLDYLAQVKLLQRRYGDAEDYLKRAMPIAEKATGTESQLMLTLMDHMISVLKAQGREPEAKVLLDRANAIISKSRVR